MMMTSVLLAVSLKPPAAVMAWWIVTGTGQGEHAGTEDLAVHVDPLHAEGADDDADLGPVDLLAVAALKGLPQSSGVRPAAVTSFASWREIRPSGRTMIVSFSSGL